ncbi:hypothetical protein [Acidithiobacillus ferridurans]|uniref:Uncharacterized protein n=2 Tax=Acidithiobacillus ferridurans TaxID=1232575 RepID=A0A2Z6IF96_ACIFI|nr:hypothetical protein [Acidithiobacillus ferridurans]MBU2717012.1 hypothetical protein [Acidithiobacillus ferridurans]MBU2723737.1 hypothetical protein [Acidithiobacillus ferridurans]MBU2727564.1 hypothetical protein [Acidithiobacillus ferridurans]BBF63976.1 hypothetical protein AFERRID_01940 [Acidithiobacillus ferridurans]
MNGATKKVISRTVVGEHIDIRMLTTILIKHFKKKTGHYELAPEFAFSVVQAGPSPDKVMPTVMVGLSRMALVEVSEATQMSVDAGAIQKKK